MLVSKTLIFTSWNLLVKVYSNLITMTCLYSPRKTLSITIHLKPFRSTDCFRISWECQKKCIFWCFHRFFKEYTDLKQRISITQCTNTSSLWMNKIQKYLDIIIFTGVFTCNSRIINIPRDQKSASFQKFSPDNYKIILKATKINKFDQRLYL